MSIVNEIDSAFQTPKLFDIDLKIKSKLVDGSTESKRGSSLYKIKVYIF